MRQWFSEGTGFDGITELTEFLLGEGRGVFEGINKINMIFWEGFFGSILSK
jgi:hypothetical protein